MSTPAAVPPPNAERVAAVRGVLRTTVVVPGIDGAVVLLAPLVAVDRRLKHETHN